MKDLIYEVLNPFCHYNKLLMVGISIALICIDMAYICIHQCTAIAWNNVLQHIIEITNMLILRRITSSHGL